MTTSEIARRRSRIDRRPGPMRLFIHFIANPDSKSIESACGRWDTGVNWTKMRNTVTCPRCLERLEAADARQPARVAKATGAA